MKVSLKDYLQSQKKAGLVDVVEKHLANLPPVDDTKTFHLSPTGGEIHNGESMVDRISKPESLREKVARFERLAARVRESMYHKMELAKEFIGEDENPDDFDFDDGEFVDEFGDVHIPMSGKDVEIGDGDGEKSPATPSQGDEQPSKEPVSEPEEN